MKELEVGENSEDQIELKQVLFYECHDFSNLS